MLALLIATTSGITVARADSPTETFGATKSSLLKNTGWSTSNAPAAGTTSIVDSNSSYPTTNAPAPIGWNVNSPGTSAMGDLDITSGGSNLVIGDYNTTLTGSQSVLNPPLTITFGGSTLNSIANTIIANSSGTPVVFENDVVVPTDYNAEAGLSTYALGNTANVIQATATSNIIIDNVITGSGDALTFLGGGGVSTTGATLELGAGSANDVVGGVAPNAPVPANGGAFTGTAVVQSSDVNTFSGGLTIGDAAGTANAGVVQADGAHALPTTGTVTVNPNSQLYLNGSATYGGSAQSLVLNGSGTHTISGALTTHAGDSSTWAGTLNVATNSAINVQGSAGSLAVSGALGGSGQLQTTGAGTLTLNGNSSAFPGGFEVSNGTLDAGNANALGSGAVSVAGGTLGSTVSSVNFGSALSLSSGVIALDQSTFSLATGQNFAVTGGTIDLTDVSGSVGAITSAGSGTFSLTSGVLDLGGNTWNYANSYNILSGFSSGSVGGLTITDYDSTDYTASVSNAGVLSFSPAAVPEPSTWATLLAGLAALMGYQSRRSRRTRIG